MGAAFDGDDITVVTELLDGDLEHICLRDSSISLYQRMVWAKQAAEGMAWVHGAGVIHRDLKPSNLLYSRKENSVKVSAGLFFIVLFLKERNSSSISFFRSAISVLQFSKRTKLVLHNSKVALSTLLLRCFGARAQLQSLMFIPLVSFCTFSSLWRSSL